MCMVALSMTLSTSDNNANTGTGANDPNSWTVTYNGPGYVERS